MPTFLGQQYLLAIVKNFSSGRRKCILTLLAVYIDYHNTNVYEVVRVRMRDNDERFSIYFGCKIF